MRPIGVPLSMEQGSAGKEGDTRRTRNKMEDLTKINISTFHPENAYRASFFCIERDEEKKQTEKGPAFCSAKHIPTSEMSVLVSDRNGIDQKGFSPRKSRK